MKVDTLWVINPKPQCIGPESQLDNLHCCIDSLVDVRLRNWVRRKFDCFRTIKAFNHESWIDCYDKVDIANYKMLIMTGK